MTFDEYLKKYGVIAQKKHLSYTPWPKRNGQKLTRFFVHTEGVPQDSQINGTKDRDVFSWFNNKSNRANAHGFITFSGRFIEYIPIEHGNWAIGNDDDNVQNYSVEHQDNGRWNNPDTYTNAQVSTLARVMCAVKDYAKEHYGTDIQLAHNEWGIMKHNDRIPSRACPGAFPFDKAIGRAHLIYEKVNMLSEQKLQKEISLLKSKLSSAELALVRQENDATAISKRYSDLEASMRDLEHIVKIKESEIEFLDSELEKMREADLISLPRNRFTKLLLNLYKLFNP